MKLNFRIVSRLDLLKYSQREIKNQDFHIESVE